MANVPSIGSPRCWELCPGQRPYANLVADARLQSSRPVTSRPGAEASRSSPLQRPTGRGPRDRCASVRLFDLGEAKLAIPRGFLGSITGLREDKMRGRELFAPAEPAMGNFASLVGATLESSFCDRPQSPAAALRRQNRPVTIRPCESARMVTRRKVKRSR